MVQKDYSPIEIKKELTLWVKSYSKDLLKWANYKVNSKANAEDLVQETFMAAVKGFERFKGDSNPRTWLFQILNHKIIDFYRKNTNTLLPLDEIRARELTDSMFDRHQNWEVNGFEAAWENENLFDNPDFEKTFSGCMLELPEKWSKILADKYFFQKKTDEVCQENGISPTNYWQILHRSKLLMKKCLENKWPKN